MVPLPLAAARGSLLGASPASALSASHQMDLEPTELEVATTLVTFGRLAAKHSAACVLKQRQDLAHSLTGW